MKAKLLGTAMLGVILASCSGETNMPQANLPLNAAEVIQVEVKGNPQAYTFVVTVRSPDTGCEQYANWWEVVSLDGQLLYRRILLHSHVNEQPFTRSGGSVAIAADQEVIVRSHLHPSGYGNQGMRGSVARGFETVTFPAEFASGLAQEEPLPNGCTF